MATDLQWTEIADFRSGIFNRSQNALGSPGVALPAPLGAAQETNTYRCYALPTGGLAPLPKQTRTFSITAPEGTAPSSGYWIVGMFVFGPESVGIGTVSTQTDSAFVCIAYTPNGSTNQRMRLVRLQMFKTPFAFSTIRSINSAWAGTNFYEPAWFCTSRALNAGPYTAPGNPIVAFSWATPGASNEITLDVFPSTAAVGVEGMQNISTTRWGRILGHQGRLVLLEFIAYLFGGTGGIATNEQISFTDPPNSIVLGSQQQIFMQEYPNGFAVDGSISAGELLLVKQQGGGLIVSGDIAFPSITRLPGITGGGGVTSNGTSTPVGFLYGTRQMGPCMWRGSDTSDAVATQLDPHSFFPSQYVAAAPGNVGGGDISIGMLQNFETWGPFAYCTNNWVLDTRNNGWWIAEDRSVINIMHWSRGYNGRNMYGSPSSFMQGSPVVCYNFDLETPALSYSWMGHPIVSGVQNRVLTIREIVLIAEGSGTVTITMTKLDGTTQSEAFTVTNTTQPQRLRVTTAAQCYSIVPRIVSDGGSNPAPIVHKVNFGWEESLEAVAS